MLVACGGGGGGSSDTSSGGNDTPTVQAPPGSAASLSVSTNEASVAAKTAVDEASATATQQSSLDGLFAAFGVQPTQASSSNATLKRALAAARSAGMKHALAAQTVSCTEVFDGGCTGSVSVDTNIADDAASVRAGQYIDMTFTGASGTLEGVAYSMSGRVRLDFLADWSGQSIGGLHFRITSQGFSGSAYGIAFGPVTEAVEVAFDNSGAATVTLNGRAYSALGGVSVTDVSNYAIGSGTVRTAYGSSGGYVDVGYANWQVAQGRPAVGSSATITGANGAQAVITVTSSSTASVVYHVTVSVGSTSAAYTVTAAYNGNTPTYTVVGAG